MERLEIKTIKGKKYYYHSKWGRKDGKPRRLWQKYIGTLEDLLAKCSNSREGTADLYEWGQSTALIGECQNTEIIKHIDSVSEKWRKSSRKVRDQGLSVGEYIAIAAINRAGTEVCSKRSMWGSLLFSFIKLPFAASSAIHAGISKALATTITIADAFFYSLCLFFGTYTIHLLQQRTVVYPPIQPMNPIKNQFHTSHKRAAH